MKLRCSFFEKPFIFSVKNMHGGRSLLLICSCLLLRAALPWTECGWTWWVNSIRCYGAIRSKFLVQWSYTSFDFDSGQQTGHGKGKQSPSKSSVSTSYMKLWYEICEEIYINKWMAWEPLLASAGSPYVHARIPASQFALFPARSLQSTS